LGRTSPQLAHPNDQYPSDHCNNAMDNLYLEVNNSAKAILAHSHFSDIFNAIVDVVLVYLGPELPTWR
jgi:hypothetical protein